MLGKSPGLGMAGTHSPGGLPPRAENPACRSEQAAFWPSPHPCQVRVLGAGVDGVGTREVQTEGLVPGEEGEARFSGLGLPGETKSPGSTAQEPSRPRPDRKEVRAWSPEL